MSSFINTLILQFSSLFYSDFITVSSLSMCLIVSNVFANLWWKKSFFPKALLSKMWEVRNEISSRNCSMQDIGIQCITSQLFLWFKKYPFNKNAFGWRHNFLFSCYTCRGGPIITVAYNVFMNYIYVCTCEFQRFPVSRKINSKNEVHCLFCDTVFYNGL